MQKHINQRVKELEEETAKQKEQIAELYSMVVDDSPSEDEETAPGEELTNQE